MFALRYVTLRYVTLRYVTLRSRILTHAGSRTKTRKQEESGDIRMNNKELETNIHKIRVYTVTNYMITL